MEPSEKAYAIADEVVLGALGVGNAAQVIQRALDEAAAAERAKVVALLKFQAEWHDRHDDGLSGFDRIAQAARDFIDLIEQGAHHDPA